MSGLNEISMKVPQGEVQGKCAPGWEPVVDAFAQNFRARDEIGASFCVTHHGETKIDLWGGFADQARGRPWREDTISVVFSATKGATALCAHVLASRGLLDLKAPVAKYWPEFAKNGKENATVEMMLNHSVGVPGFREPIKEEAFADWDYMIKRLEEEPAFWEPGLRNGYHLLNIGWTVGELVRRVSGKSLGTFFHDEIASKLGLDFYIGLPAEHEDRVSLIVPYIPKAGDVMTEFYEACVENPEADSSKALLNTGGFNPARFDEKNGRYATDTRTAHAAEIGGAGGITNARGLAGMYAPLANGGGWIVAADDVWRMSQISMVSHRDPILLVPTRFALGFMKSVDNRHLPMGDEKSMIIGDRGFGHVGAGGSLGFADPDCNLSFGYTMNRMGVGVFLNQRGQSLVDAVYTKLGYRSNKSGVWAK